MRIHLAVPITGLDDAAIGLRTAFLETIARPGTEITYSRVREGPPAIESPVDHAQAAAEVQARRSRETRWHRMTPAGHQSF